MTGANPITSRSALRRFDHDFLGRAALEKLAHGPHQKKVWLRWHDDDAQRVIRLQLRDPAV